MNRSTRRMHIDGPAGLLELAWDEPAQAPRGLALVAHPHPLHGGTLDNKVAQTLARAWVQMGFVVVRPNFRGVGRSQGSYAEGVGETEDLRAVWEFARAELGAPAADLPLALAGFSFGGFVAANLCRQLRAESVPVQHLCLVAPAVARFAVPTLRDQAASLAPRMLVVHGEHDEVVPLAAVLDWARPQAQPVLVVPGAGHFFHGLLTPLKDWICAWHGGGAEAPR